MKSASTSRASVAYSSPILLGVIAETFGLAVSMWLLCLGPLALLVGEGSHRVEAVQGKPRRVLGSREAPHVHTARPAWP